MDKQSFIEQITTMQEPLRRFLLVLTHGDSDLADDLAQEAMLRAYLHCSTFEEQSALTTWIYRIAYNRYLDWQKSYWVQHRDGIDDSESAQALPADDAPDRAFLYEPLYRAIDALPPQEKAVVLLYYMDEKSLREIHAITNLSMGTITSHLFRARKRLKKMLTPPTPSRAPHVVLSGS